MPDMADFDFEALGSAIGSALAKGLDENELRKDQREQERAESERQQQEAVEAAEAQREALEHVTRTFERERERVGLMVDAAAGSVLAKARANMRQSLRDDPRMPRTINYQERYNALVDLQDRSKVLSLLKGTLDLADTILADVGDVNVQEAVQDAAGGFRRSLHVVDGVIVCQPEHRAEELFEEGEALRLVKDEVEPLGFGELVRQAFYESFGDLTETERKALVADKTEQERKEVREKRLEKACEAAVRAGEVYRHTLAQEVSGAALETGELAAFSGKACATLRRDPAEVRQLSAAVRMSFKTFTQVVQDNGLYAAFSSRGDYGACKGYSYSWWDAFDDEYDVAFGYCGRRPNGMASIPSAVQEDEGGDTTERAIERMAAFNKLPYDGFFDDDFQQHVDAFWYGFRKFMEDVNGLFEVDLSELNGYCGDLSADVMGKVRVLAVRMDEHQAVRFSGDIKARARKLETE